MKSLFATSLCGIFGLFSAILPAQTNSLWITEVNYHSDSSNSTGDWFELYNAGSAAINLSGYRLRDQNQLNLFIFPTGISLPAGGYLVVCADTVKFDQYHTISNRMGNFSFGLGNMADSIRLFDATNQPVLRMGYLDSMPWPKGADGYGRTLELLPGATDLNNPASWYTGCIFGSPGGPFVPCSQERVVVSEINYNSPATDDAGDWFEIHNLDGVAKNLAGWRIRDRNNLNEFIFPAGTTLAANGYLVLYNNDVLFNQQHPGIPNKVGPFPFSLGNSGDAIRLYDENDRIVFSVRYNDLAPWPTEADGNGYTLEALPDFDPSRDVNSHNSWTFRCIGGSPGRAAPADCFASVEEQINEALVSIYPNPVTSHLTMESKTQDRFTLRFTDALGRILAMPEGLYAQFTFTVLPEWPAGVYFLHGQSEFGNHHFTQKILIP